MASSGLWKMFSYIICNTKWCMGNVFLCNIDFNFYYNCLADVMPDCVIGRCFLPGRCYLPFGMWQMLLPRGRCYPLFLMIGRCYCHIFCRRCIYFVLCCNTLNWLMLFAKWQMEKPHILIICCDADVIAQWQMNGHCRVVVVYLLVDVIPRPDGCSWV